VSVRIIVLSLGLAIIAGILFAIVKVVQGWRGVRRQAQRSGYASVGDYLRAAPRSDEEKRDAVDMAMKGLILCFVGLVFPPLILFGALPLCYGARTIAYASMGLGLVDDSLVDDEPATGS
jgi:hypothetical protein